MKINNKLKLWSIVIALALLACVCSSSVGDEEEISVTSTEIGKNIETISTTDLEENRFGYSIEERKRIFYELVQAEDQTQALANLLFPTPDVFSADYNPDMMMTAVFGNHDYFRENEEAYHLEVADRFGITLDELREISIEGAIYEWPLPPLGESVGQSETQPLEPTPNQIVGQINIGTYLVGNDIEPGIYWGLAGAGIFDSCYWARLSDLTGDLESLIANDNAVGQFYVEVKGTDYAFETRCELIPLDYAPVIDIGDILAPGIFLIGRDAKPGLYQGQGGEDLLDSCYWARLKNVSGDLLSISANGNANGSFYIQVLESDFALKTACPLEWISE